MPTESIIRIAEYLNNLRPGTPIATTNKIFKSGFLELGYMPGRLPYPTIGFKPRSALGCPKLIIKPNAYCTIMEAEPSYAIIIPDNVNTMVIYPGYSQIYVDNQIDEPLSYFGREVTIKKIETQIKMGKANKKTLTKKEITPFLRTRKFAVSF